MVKNLLANAGDISLMPGSRRSPGDVNSNPLMYSCLENHMDRGAWKATVHGVAKESDMTSLLNNNIGINCLKKSLRRHVQGRRKT